MSVYKRGKTWEVAIGHGKDPRTGRPARLTWTFDTEAAAKDFERRKKEELRRLKEQHVRPSVTRLADYLPDWLRRKENEGLAPRTVADYDWCIKKLILPSLGAEPLADLSPAKVQAWQDALAPTRSTRGATIAAKAHRVLRAALSDAERLGMIARNPAKAARPAMRSPNKREGFTLAEAHAILAAAQGERLEPLFAFMLHSGVRVAEALGLRWRDVDLEAGTVSIRQDMVAVTGRGMVAGKPKTKTSVRTFAMLPQAVEDLRRQKARQAEEQLAAGEDWQDNDLIFTATARQFGGVRNRPGGPLFTSNVDRAFVRIREKAGVRALPLYSMRHAAASVLLGSGVPVAVAAKMMGHSVNMFCETYADLLVEATREAAATAGAWLEANKPEPRAPAQVVPIQRAKAGRRRKAAG